MSLLFLYNLRISLIISLKFHIDRLSREGKQLDHSLETDPFHIFFRTASALKSSISIKNNSFFEENYLILFKI